MLALYAPYAAALLFVVLPCAYLLRRYPAPATPLGAQLCAFAAYGAALMCTALVPLDMLWLYQANARPVEAVLRAKAGLAVAWNCAYFAAVAATVLLPLVQVRGWLHVARARVADDAHPRPSTRHTRGRLSVAYAMRRTPPAASMRSSQPRRPSACARCW